MGYAFIYAAVGIALGVTLITEAIILMQASLWFLAETGKHWKTQETNIKAGIDGIKSVMESVLYLSPILIIAGTIGVMFGSASMAAGPAGSALTAGVGITAFVAAAVAIAGIVMLITETIILMEAPLYELAQLGRKSESLLPTAKKGLEAIDVIGKTFGVVGEILGSLNKKQSSFMDNIGGILGRALIGAATSAVVGPIVSLIGNNIFPIFFLCF